MEPAIFMLFGRVRGNVPANCCVVAVDLRITDAKLNLWGIVLTGAFAERERCSMFNFSAKGAFVCATLPIGLLLSGCGGMGSAGFHEVVAGNWPAAKQDFAEDYQSD